MLPPFEYESPGRKPPSEVRIRDLHVELWPDGRRVRVHLELTPFEQKPSVDLTITTSGGDPVAATSIVENMVFKLVITMHLRGVEDPAGSYQVHATVYYPDQEPVDQATAAFSVPGAASPEG